MVFFLSRCTCLPCYRCLRVINFVKIRKPYFAVVGQQSNLNVFNFTISSDCFEVVQTNRMQETVTVNLCSHSVQFSPPSFYVTKRWERDSPSFPALRDRERSQNWTMFTLYTEQLFVPTQELLGIVYSVIWLSTLEIANRSFAPLQIACSQTLYFLIKVRRARVIKNEPRGIYWPRQRKGVGVGENGIFFFLAHASVFEKNEKKNKTTSVYRLQ